MKITPWRLAAASARLTAAATLIAAGLPTLGAQVARAYGGLPVPTLPGGPSAYPTAMSPSGHVVGVSKNANGKDHAFSYRNGETTDLGALGAASQAPFAESAAYAVSAAGAAAGESGGTAVIFQNGGVSALPRFYTEGIAESAAYGINSSGHVVGAATSATQRQFLGGQTKGPPHAFLYRNGQMTDLGTIGGVAGASVAYAINDRGQVAGQSDTPGGNGFDHAFLWENGQMRDIGTLPGYEESAATSINAAGTVAGRATRTSSLFLVRRGFVYSGGAMRDIGGLSAGGNSSANAVSDSGLVVGTADTPSGQAVAVAYTAERGLVDLNSLLTLPYASHPGVSARLVRLTSAVAVNGEGRIACLALYSDGATRPFVLVPGAEPPAIASQPLSVSVEPGGSVTFSVAATGGALSYQWLKGGSPIAGATGASFTIASATRADDGSYAVVVTNASGSVTSLPALLRVVDGSEQSWLANISIRSTASAGDGVLIVGFSIGGPGTVGAKPVLMRGVGPSLASFGVGGVLTDPVISLFSGAAKVAENDDWGGSAQVVAAASQVGAFAVASPSSRDAALFSPATAAGGYSLQVSGAGGSSGVVLAEIYDATPRDSFSRSTPRLVNASARAHAGAGSDVLIVGFAVAGSGAKHVLVRAVGPSLSLFGVGGALADPQLRVYDSGGREVAAGDDWPAALAGVFANVGAFPLPAGSKDAALTLALEPGAYTAQVSGAAGGTGVALVELYEIP